MKTIVVSLILCAALPSAAQGNLAKKASEGAFSKSAEQILRQAVPNNILRNARVAQGKILPGGSPTTAPYMQDIERHIFRHVPPRGISRLEDPTPAQARQVSAWYTQVMNNFKQFRKEMDGFLYYQSKPSEKRVLSVSERGMWARKIVQMNFQLEKIRPFIFSKDEAYQAACAYVAYAARIVDPLLCSAVSLPLYASPNRVYKQSEFFLHAPRAWRTVRLGKNSPQQLTIVVLNDEPELLDNFLWLQQSGTLPKGWQVFCYTEPEKLIQDVTRQIQKPDLILTDIIVPGGGGYYVTGMLRAAGYQGAIVGLSAFTEKDSMGRNMFAAGFDGMIYSPLELEYDPQWGNKILDKIHYYFYYRRLHGWQR